MTCDPKKIFTDLDVVGAVLSYAELWVAGTLKEVDTSNTNSDLIVFNFRYKSIDTSRNYHNIFTYSNNVLQSAEIRTGVFDNSDPTAGNLIEKIDYV